MNIDFRDVEIEILSAGSYEFLYTMKAQLQRLLNICDKREKELDIIHQVEDSKE